MTSSSAFGLVVVGDEILNGRRRDRHFAAIGALLRERGFGLAWFRVLPDDPDYLAAELRRTMAERRPVFCCGGIGATPDDHTRTSAAAAADVGIELHPGAVAEIEARFGEAAYPQRIRMAELPVGADLIPNPYNRIPGFSLNHHFFLPGFPDMAHPMVRWVLDTHYPQGGRVERQRSVRVFGITESGLTDLMETLVATYPEAKFFSLPRLGPEFQIELGFRGSGDLAPAFSALCAGLEARGARFEELSD